MKQKLRLILLGIMYGVLIQLTFIVAAIGFASIASASFISPQDNSTLNSTIVTLNYNVSNESVTLFNTTYSDCYQESANVVNQTGIDGDCNLNYGGSYDIDTEDYVYEPSLINDGDWSTFGLLGYGTRNAYINYTKPTNAVNATWQVELGRDMISDNLTLPNECFNADPNNLILKIYSIRPNNPSRAYASCYNGSDWIYLYSGSVGPSIFEEAIIWNISTVNNYTVYPNSTIDDFYYVVNNNTDGTERVYPNDTTNLSVDYFAQEGFNQVFAIYNISGTIYNDSISFNVTLPIPEPVVYSVQPVGHEISGGGGGSYVKPVVKNLTNQTNQTVQPIVQKPIVNNTQTPQVSVPQTPTQKSNYNIYVWIVSILAIGLFLYLVIRHLTKPKDAEVDTNLPDKIE